jgi:hypothetical protein
MFSTLTFAIYEVQRVFIAYLFHVLNYSPFQLVRETLFLALKKILMIKYNKFFVCECSISFPIWIQCNFSHMALFFSENSKNQNLHD